MKILILLLSISFLIACHDDDILGGPYDPCIQEKIESFITEEFAMDIIRLDGPTETWFWFRSITADAGESVFNHNCLSNCVADVDFISEHVCDASILDLPRTVIWEK